ncbi:hypothetical protein SGFS_003960 [Streptomyces graminofaciens]|uniref:Uncharacterized protein n=1 Tax=Streptomyces graminofaciens TaxID=68212 RepID=A0ABM7F086_9ACTN|nr:hypothetical protein SGFS_003960 [Streptomyces graminofaciens]
MEKFRTITGTPAGTNDLLTAYKVDQPAVASAAARWTPCWGQARCKGGGLPVGGTDAGRAGPEPLVRRC